MTLLIRGGTLVDGTGAPGRRADVLVRDGRITEIAAAIEPPEGAEVIDATGCVVAPGFIDTHTHVDPALFWDRTCDPLPQHGVTSVLVGNCSLSLAPVRPEMTGALSSLFCYIEDLPEAVFERSVPYVWQTYREYLDVLDAEPSAVNVATLVGHTPLRLWALGDEAWDRASTAAELEVIAGALDDALATGAFGMSTSLGFDADRQGRPVPSRVASSDELGALVDVLADHDRLLQFLPSPGFRRMQQDVTMVADLTRPRAVTSTWIGIFHDAALPAMATDLLDFASALQAGGVPTYPQVSPRTLDMQVNWSGGMSFKAMEAYWHPMVQAPADDKRAILTDPAWRAAARAEWDVCPWAILPHRHPERVRFVDVTDPSLSRWVGATLADLMAERGGHPSDVLADWVLENDLAPGVVGIGVANSDPDGVAATLRHPASVVSNSDAGAHLQMMCAAGDSTLLLTRHVRDRGDLTLEQAIHALTGRQAEVFGFEARGVVAPGNHADLVVFDLDELHWDRDEMVDDLPTGARRLRRPPGGYRATIAAGVATQLGGELTGARPGRVLRRGIGDGV